MMEQNMLENSKMIFTMVTVQLLGKTVQNIQGAGKKVKDMEKVNTNIQMETFTMDHGKKV